MTPTNFGRYIVTQPLPSGGMADLYLAHDPVLDRDVVIKVPKVERLSPAGRERFEREARAVAGLAGCPEIVTLYDFGEQDGAPYLVMRYMSGGTLDERIEQGAFSLEQAAPVIERVAAALDYAHGRGIVHRDVKPANILFDADGNAYLSDFGIATAPPSDLNDESTTSETRLRLTAFGSSPGTPGYRSPEQALGEDELDGRSDVYSLGIVLFEMLAGKMPLQASIPRITDNRDDLPVDMQQLFDRALAKDRGNRYAKASSLAADLQKIIAGAPLSADNGSSQAKDAKSAAEKSIEKEDGNSGTGGISLGVLAIISLTLAALALSTFALLRDRGVDVDATPIVVITAVTQFTPTEEPAEESTEKPAEESTEEPAEPPSTSTSVPESPTETSTTEPDSTDTVDHGPLTFKLGSTSRGTPIEVYRFGNGPQKVLFVGGLTGGYAPSTSAVAQQAVDYFTREPEEIPDGLTVFIIPLLSPDAVNAPGEFAGRLNGNGVDLNRNWGCEWTPNPQWSGQTRRGSGGPEPFSEVENRLLRDFILSENPAAIVFWFARANDGLVSPGGCGPTVLVSDVPAAIFAQASGYRSANFGDVPGAVVNGDATNWLDSVGIPAVSVLLPSFTTVDWENNLNGMLAVMSEYARRSLPPPVNITQSTSPAPETCSINPGPRWGTLWNTHRRRLGCAQNGERKTNAAFQYYQNGTMIWRGDRELIYVLYDDGGFGTHDALAGPKGYFHSDILKGAFGYLWNNNAAVRNRLGQPLTLEYNATDFTVQDFAGGTIFYFYDNGDHDFALFTDNNTWIED